MNRKIPPVIEDIKKVDLPTPEIFNFLNDSVLYCTYAHGLPVIRVEIVIMAGRPFEKKRIISKLTGRLLKDGTKTKTAKQIADFFDNYGATINTSSNLDYITITLHCLRKYFEQLWPVVVEVLMEPGFHEQDMLTYINNSIQKLEIDLTKPEVVAYRTITEKIFGTNHPYGYNSTTELYKAANQQDLFDHFNANFLPAQTSVHLSGGYMECDLDLIMNTLKSWEAKPRPKPVIPSIDIINPERLHLEIDSSSQSSLRLGRKMFARSHPDYIDMFILNTLLGGFFGSRLNMNIRENKGMTYSIGSSLETLSFDGCFIVMADMSHEHINKAIKLIFKEFKKLSDQPIDDDELLQLKRYLIGTLINAVDGPFNSSGLIKSLVADQVGLSIWDQATSRINSIQATEIMATAQMYLQPDDFWVVSSGKRIV